MKSFLQLRDKYWRGARGRLFLLVWLTVLPLLVVQVASAWNDLQQDISAGKLDITRASDHAQADFVTLMNQAGTVFGDLARMDATHTPNNCTRVYTDLRFAFMRLMPEATNIGLSDAEGNLYCTVYPMQNASDNAFQTQDLSLGDYTLDPISDEPALNVTYPVKSPDGELQTVIHASFGLEWLTAWFNEVALPAGTALTLVTPDGQGLYHAIDGAVAPAESPVIQAAAWSAARQGKPNVAEASGPDGVRRLYTLVPLVADSQIAAYLYLGYPVETFYTKAYQSLWWKLALLGLTLVAALLLAWWGSEQLFLYPLQRLMGVVSQVQGGDLHARVSALQGLAELTQLAQAFDRMTDALQQREDARQQAQTGLEQSDARFRAMFETSAVGIGILGLDRKIIDANPAMCGMFGRMREEFIGQTPSIATYPEDYPKSTEEFEELLSGKRAYYWDERRYVRTNGEVFWAHVTMSVVQDAAGTPLYLVGMVIDINEQRRILGELQESEARFRAVFDNAAVGVAVMTLDRHIVQINQKAMHLTGFSEEEIYQINPSLLAFEEDRVIDRELFEELTVGKRSQYTVEKRYIRKDGTLFWGRVNFALVRGEGGKPLYTIGLIEDITEEKLSSEKLAAQEAEYRHTLEQRIAERTEELNNANKLIQQKAAQDAVVTERTRLARELHDAVTQTLFSATLIADVLPELWEINIIEGRRRLVELHQLTRGALAEMRTLLFELRPNALIDVPLPALLRQLTEAVSGRGRVTIQLSVDGDCRLTPEVQIGLYRIAQEALNNVVKHAKATQAVVTLRLGELVRLTIADNGTGFDPSTVTGDHLGIKILRERAESMGAQLSIYSEPGEGTQISVIWRPT